MNALVISNEEVKIIKKIVRSLEESGLLMYWSKGISKTIKNETKQQKAEFLGMLLGTIGASLLGNMLIGKTKIPGQRVIRKREGTIRAGQDF